MAELNYDFIHWKQDENGDLTPRGTPIAIGGEELSQPLLSVVNDETGSSFTATVTGLATGESRRLRYRATDSDVWTDFPATDSIIEGDGTIQITGLENGGYELEAYAVKGYTFGPTSVRKFVWVDDGTASAYPVSAAEVAKWQSRLAASTARCVLHSRNAVEFDPETANTDTFDDIGPLSCLAPKGMTQDLIDASGGFYSIQDFYIYVSASELSAYAAEPHETDRLTYLSTGEQFEIIGLSRKFDRAVWLLVLRK